MDRRLRSVDRRGSIRFGTIVTMVAIAAGIYGAYLVIPPYMESLQVKEALANALFMWNDKGEERAKSLFAHEVAKRGLNPDLVYACTWYELSMQKERFAECSWEVELYAPWGDHLHTLEFYVHRGINKGNEVFDADGYYE